jgi:hypothetical protein
VVGYGLFSLYVIHKEGLCPSSGDINRLMMMFIRYLDPIIQALQVFIMDKIGNREYQCYVIMNV